MTDKTEMVLVSRDELQQLIGASVRCAFEEYRQEQAPQDTSEYYTIRQLAEKWGVSIAPSGGTRSRDTSKDSG